MCSSNDIIGIIYILIFIGFKVKNNVTAATLTWNEFAYTHSDASEFKKYVIEVTQDGVIVTHDESLDITSSFEISSLGMLAGQSLESSTEYEAKIRVILHNFGQSEFSDPITIRTLPAQLSGNKLKLDFDPLENCVNQFSGTVVCILVGMSSFSRFRRNHP